MPQYSFDEPVTAAYPSCYLAFIVDAKVLSIIGEGLLADERLARLRRPWTAVFGT